MPFAKAVSAKSHGFDPKRPFVTMGGGHETDFLKMMRIVLDAGYRGEIQVILMNAGTEEFRVERGDRIAQLVVAPVVRPEWVEVETLDSTDRGEGGFGHTGRT